MKTELLAGSLILSATVIVRGPGARQESLSIVDLCYIQIKNVTEWFLKNYKKPY